MELKDQVCSRESGKRLEELGVKQNSHFYWTHCWNARLNRYDKEWIVDDKHYGTDDHKFKISAFTVAELLELLPEDLAPHEDFFGLYKLEKERGFCCHYSGPEFLDNNPAECCAKMLIYLLENKLIKLNGG